MLIELLSASFSYGGNLIFSDASFSVNEGDKIGLVGENGAGKTTLIKLMLGEIEAENGKVFVKSGLKFGYLEQNGGYESDCTVYGEMLKVFGRQIAAVEKLSELSSRLSLCEYGGAEYVRLAAKIEDLNKYVASEDCYDVEVKIKTVLNGMGFASFYDRPVSTMSGGEKTRLKLARLLLEQPDLLVLDEPTNHLDLKTLAWLEGYLSTFKGAVFVVSHDRYFLDKTVTRTLEIEDKKLFSYAGSYTKYKALKADRLERERKEYEAALEQAEKLQTYIDKNIVRATTAKSAQSRVKQLEKLEIPKKPFTPPKPPQFSFSYDERPYEDVLKVEDFNLEIGGKSLIVGGQLCVKRGKKVAITGENGAGKSTFLKAILQGGTRGITVGRLVRFAYYDQENANLDGDSTVLDELWARHVAYSQTEVRASLARCGLYPEDMQKKVSELSGGERAKLALCVFENERGNTLVLDEPTNHLDLPARESLELALKNFDGTVIFVSHDRYFISAVAGEIVEIEGGRLSVYQGGYAGYLAKKSELAAAERERVEEERFAVNAEKKESTYRTKKERADQAKRKEEIKRLEGEIAAAEQEEEGLNASLADPQITADYIKVEQITKKLQSLRERIEELYARYGELIG